MIRLVMYFCMRERKKRERERERLRLTCLIDLVHETQQQTVTEAAGDGVGGGSYVTLISPPGGGVGIPPLHLQGEGTFDRLQFKGTTLLVLCIDGVPQGRSFLREILQV